MKESELTKQNDFNFHKSEDWKTVHGLWPQMRKQIPRLNWKAAPAALSITADSTWRELDLTSETSATCFAVILAVQKAGGRWHSFYTRKKGSSASYEGISAFNVQDSISGMCAIQEHGSVIIQGVDSSQVLEYKDSSEGAATVHLIAYWDYSGGGGGGGNGGGGDVSQFLDLTDTPSSYSGQGGKVVKVTATQDGLEFSNTLPSHQHAGTDISSQVADSDTVDGQHANAFASAAHHEQHESGGNDSIKLDDLAEPDDNADLNASTSKHGLLPKLSGISSQFLNGNGVLDVPLNFFSLRMVGTDIWHSPIYNNDGFTSAIPVAGRIYAYPLICPTSVTIRRLLTTVTTGSAGKALRLGIYTNSSLNKPETLIVDSGEQSAVSGGFKKSAVISQTLAGPGVYWLAIIVSGAEYYCWIGTNVLPLLGRDFNVVYPAASKVIVGYYGDAEGGYGVLPATFPSPTILNRTDEKTPAILAEFE